MLTNESSKIKHRIFLYFFCSFLQLCHHQDSLGADRHWAVVAAKSANILSAEGRLCSRARPGSGLEGARSVTGGTGLVCCWGVYHTNLVGGWPTPLKNMKVNGKDDIPYMKWNIKNVPNHQPVSHLMGIWRFWWGLTNEVLNGSTYPNMGKLSRYDTKYGANHVLLYPWWISQKRD